MTLVTSVPVSTGTAIVTSPTMVAPLTALNGATYIVQVMNPGNGTITPANAASWSHASDGSLDVYDANAHLIASFPNGQWTNVQLIQITPPAQVVL